MPEKFYVVPESSHNELVSAAYVHRGYSEAEANAAAKFAAYASHHGIRTHNALKALHLDELFGSKSHGCVPNAVIEETGDEIRRVRNLEREQKARPSHRLRSDRNGDRAG